MGYRLEISEIKHVYCGGKLYGYVKKLGECKSYKWLLEKGFIDGTESWHYGDINTTILTADEFKEFMELYAEDFSEQYAHSIVNEKFTELLNSDTDKILEWW